MSTRANIILDDGNDVLFFYQHSDGYPEGVLPTLKQFCQLIKTGKLRANLPQSAGHLILLGREALIKCFKGQIPPHYSWKVGSIEPTTGLHGDVEFVYVIRFDDKIVIEVRECSPRYWDYPEIESTKKTKTLSFPFEKEGQ